MANGYTYEVGEGKIGFREFILKSARAFGFAILQRDDDMSAPLITHYEPNIARYDAEIVRYKARLAVLDYLERSPHDLADAVETQYREALGQYLEYKAASATRTQRLEEMITQVQAWEVPTELVDMKRTVLGWLEEDLRWEKYNGTQPVRQTPQEYLAEARDDAQRGVDSCARHRIEEIKRTNERNHYLKLLIDSLPPQAEVGTASFKVFGKGETGKTSLILTGSEDAVE